MSYFCHSGGSQNIFIAHSQAQQFKILQFSGLPSSASPTVTLSHSGSFSYFVGASNVCFVPPRPALMNIPAAFLSVMGMRLWRVSRPTSRPRKPPFFASKTSLFCPENLLTALFVLGTVCLSSFLLRQAGRDKMQSGEEVRQVRETDWHAGDDNTQGVEDGICNLYLINIVDIFVISYSLNSLTFTPTPCD